MKTNVQLNMIVRLHIFYNSELIVRSIPSTLITYSFLLLT